jgi:hypothetical protein
MSSGNQNAVAAVYHFKSANVTVGAGPNWEKPSRQYFIEMAKGLENLALAVDALAAKTDRIEQAVIRPAPTGPGAQMGAAMAQAGKGMSLKSR